MAKEEGEKENGNVEAAAVAEASAEIDQLPKTIVRRLVKDRLSQISPNSDLSILREAQEAFTESARIFIHYLSATANDTCKDFKRQIINAEDVFKALEEMEFTEFIEPLRDCLEDFRQKNAEKKSKLPKESNQDAKGKKTLEAEAEYIQDVKKDGEELTRKNAGKKSSSTKESKGKGKRKEPPAADREDQEGGDTSGKSDNSLET